MAYYRTLTVDHAKVPSTQTDFPVLVSITDATLKTVANGGHVQRSDGFDIGFYSDSGLTTKLKWEMESYDGAAGTIVAWIKIASLSGASDTVFYMGYGNTFISADQSDPVSVWSNSFLGVWHLGNGVTLNVADSLNTNNGTNHGVTATAGKIDGCGNFVAASVQYVDVGTGMHPTSVTYSAWVKATTLPAAYNSVLVRKDSVPNYTIMRVRSDGHLSLHVTTAGGIAAYDGTGPEIVTTGNWFRIGLTYDSSLGGLVGYLNGTVDNTAGSSGALTPAAAATYIGRDPTVAGREWDGLIDEVRIASVVRSANWIATEYNNQNSPSTFMTMGSEVSTGVVSPVNTGSFLQFF